MLLVDEVHFGEERLTDRNTVPNNHPLPRAQVIDGDGQVSALCINKAEGEGDGVPA